MAENSTRQKYVKQLFCGQRNNCIMLLRALVRPQSSEKPSQGKVVFVVEINFLLLHKGSSINLAMTFLQLRDECVSAGGTGRQLSSDTSQTQKETSFPLL